MLDSVGTVMENYDMVSMIPRILGSDWAPLIYFVIIILFIDKILSETRDIPSFRHSYAIKNANFY